MEVVNARSSLLSNYEVLTLLRELEAQQLAQTRTNMAVKKETEETGEDPKGPNLVINEEVCENLRTVEFEAIQYLTSKYQPAPMQSTTSIRDLVQKLNKYDLTKAEKLQIVNLAPKQLVDIYVIVEEMEDRFPEDAARQEILAVVAESLSGQPPLSTSTPVSVPVTVDNASFGGVDDWGHDEDAEGYVDEEVYEETGEGAFEGDLDMEDE